METKENLTVLRNIFFKSFLVGLFFLILAGALYLPCKCYVANFYQSFGINIFAYQMLWVFFVGLIKTILVFLFLVPAIAIHWALKCYCKKNDIK